jgi:predicted aspartyl protease
MGRIIASVTVESFANPQLSLRCDALVDTGASHLVLPSAWKDRLGELQLLEKVDVEVADQSVMSGEIRGPVKVQIEGFRATSTEVLFLDMKPENGVYEPLLGYIVLEQSLAAVDMIGHRLVHVKHFDVK